MTVGRLFAGIIFVVLLIALLSCSVVKKPAQEDVLPPTPAYLFPTVPGESDMLARRLARVAESVPGVRHATLILSRTTVIAGLELDPGVPKDGLFASVAGKLKEEDVRIHTVRITCDREVVARIKHIAGGIRNGTPVTVYEDELVQIMRRIPPVNL